MAHPVDFTGSNVKLVAPDGREDVGALRAFRNGKVVVTCWELTDEELERMIANRKVYVAQFSGSTIYPTFVGDDRSVRFVVADTGKTIPQQD